MRGLLTGVIWGIAVSAAGLVVATQILPERSLSSGPGAPLATGETAHGEVGRVNGPATADAPAATGRNAGGEAGTAGQAAPDGVDLSDGTASGTAEGSRDAAPGDAEPRETALPDTETPGAVGSGPFGNDTARAADAVSQPGAEPVDAPMRDGGRNADRGAPEDEPATRVGPALVDDGADAGTDGADQGDAPPVRDAGRATEGQSGDGGASERGPDSESVSSTDGEGVDATPDGVSDPSAFPGGTEGEASDASDHGQRRGETADAASRVASGVAANDRGAPDAGSEGAASALAAPDRAEGDGGAAKIDGEDAFDADVVAWADGDAARPFTDGMVAGDDGEDTRAARGSVASPSEGGVSGDARSATTSIEAETAIDGGEPATVPGQNGRAEGGAENPDTPDGTALPGRAASEGAPMKTEAGPSVPAEPASPTDNASEVDPPRPAALTRARGLGSAPRAEGAAADQAPAVDSAPPAVAPGGATSPEAETAADLPDAPRAPDAAQGPARAEAAPAIGDAPTAPASEDRSADRLEMAALAPPVGDTAPPDLRAPAPRGPGAVGDAAFDARASTPDLSGAPRGPGDGTTSADTEIAADASPSESSASVAPGDATTEADTGTGADASLSDRSSPSASSDAIARGQTGSAAGPASAAAVSPPVGAPLAEAADGAAPGAAGGADAGVDGTPDAAPVEDAAPPAEESLDSDEGGPSATGIVTDRLPQIGAPAPETPPADPAPDTPGIPGARGALAENAVPFDAAGGAIMSIVLIDRPGASIPTDLPVTLAVSAGDPDVAGRARAWRQSGRELAVMPAVPQGATDIDTAEALGNSLDIVPGAALVLAPEALSGATAAEQLARSVAQSGHGLLAPGGGLGGLVRAAERAEVRAASIYREVDAQGRDAAATARFLDQAAFEARRNGAIVVLATARPETIRAIEAWMTGARAATVGLAPASAALAPPS